MSRSWWIRFSVFLVVTLFSFLYVCPTAFNLDPETSKFPFKQKINLGLDLQGGLYMVLGVDLPGAYREILARQVQSFENRAKEKKLPLTEVKVLTTQSGEAEGSQASLLQEDPHARVTFEATHRTELYELLKKEFRTLRLVGDADSHFELGLSSEYRQEIRERTVGQSIEVIRNRIDEFGVSEPQIASQGVDRIVVELPGVREMERAKELIGRTAKLEFKLVDENVSINDLQRWIEDAEKEKNIQYKEGQNYTTYVKAINAALAGKIPAKDVIAFERNKNDKGDTVLVPYAVTAEAEITGNDLQEANVHVDPESRRPAVGFTLNAHGASKFERLTGDNIGKRLAIILDNSIYSAPPIQSRIGAHGQISLGRRQADNDHLMKEAKDLANVLRAGALPAQLEFQEQRVVGPSLGQDSVAKGALASLLGCLAVFLFVLFYYRVSGAIAVFTLILNVLYVLALLVGLEATLTLPGIAGIALTVGIAVDSNVVIYERIREELRAGKRAASAVEAGFQKAFRTIVDANVTNAIAALVLINFGTGPIKGFAVTLLVGIVTTLFTAVFVCKLAFAVYLRLLETKRVKQLSI